MAKDKNKELEYYAEGLRRMKNRKETRRQKYFTAVAEAKDLRGLGVSLSSVKRNEPWKDSSSPTGYSQTCSYQGVCQYPCNGDC
jgi:hypothetical protein